MGRPAGHFDRRLDSAEAASLLVAELVRELRKALDAADATLRLVLTEFLAIRSPPFWRVKSTSRGEQCRISAGIFYQDSPSQSMNNHIRSKGGIEA